MIYTGGTSPQALRKELTSARRGHLDDRPRHRRPVRASTPSTFQSSTSALSATPSAIFRYTPIGGGRVHPEAAWVGAHIVTEQVPILGR